MTPFLAAAGKNLAPVGCFHSLAEAHLALALDIGFVTKVVFHFALVLNMLEPDRSGIISQFTPAASQTAQTAQTASMQELLIDP